MFIISSLHLGGAHSRAPTNTTSKVKLFCWVSVQNHAKLKGAQTSRITQETKTQSTMEGHGGTADVTKAEEEEQRLLIH